MLSSVKFTTLGALNVGVWAITVTTKAELFQNLRKGLSVNIQLFRFRFSGIVYIFKDQI